VSSTSELPSAGLHHELIEQQASPCSHPESRKRAREDELMEISCARTRGWVTPQKICAADPTENDIGFSDDDEEEEEDAEEEEDEDVEEDEEKVEGEKEIQGSQDEEDRGGVEGDGIAREALREGR
jgi:hypothetical protein